MKLSTISKSVVTAAAVAIATTRCSTGGGKGVIDGANTKVVDSVVWHNHAQIDPVTAFKQPVDADKSRLVFIRSLDNDPIQSSANIAVNNRYQVSLHPNSYTETMGCAGDNVISAEITGTKSNNLVSNAKKTYLAPQSTNYFYVDVNGQTGAASIQQVDENTAQELLKEQGYQTHQLSRVQSIECATQVEANTPIDLHVEFDFDKSAVRPVYNSRFQAVADYMKAHPEAVALVEGHTDSLGDAGYNLKLSTERATAVKDHLVSVYGVDKARIQSSGGR